MEYEEKSKIVVGRLKSFANAFMLLPEQGVDDRLYHLSNTVDPKSVHNAVHNIVIFKIENDQYSAEPYRIVSIENLPKKKDTALYSPGKRWKLLRRNLS